MLANRTGVTRGGDLRRRCRQGSSTQGTLSGGLISVAVPWIAAQPFWSSFFRLSARAACALVRTLVHEVRLSTGRTQDKYSSPCGFFVHPVLDKLPLSSTGQPPERSRRICLWSPPCLPKLGTAADAWKGPSSDRAQQWTRQARTNLRRGRFWSLGRSHASCAFAHDRTGVQAPDAVIAHLTEGGAHLRRPGLRTCWNRSVMPARSAAGQSMPSRSGDDQHVAIA